MVAAALWPERDEESARHNLRQTLLYARQQFSDEAVFADRTSVELGGDIRIDVQSYQHLSQSAGQDRERIEAFEKAVSLYRGAFLEGLDDDWILEPRAQLSRSYVTTLLRLADHYLPARPDKALEYANKAVSEEPLLDGARARKILALRKVGEEAAALQEFEAFANLLDDELGMTPSQIVEEALREPVGAGKAQFKTDTSGVPPDVSTIVYELAAGDSPERAVELSNALTPYWIWKGMANAGKQLLEHSLTASQPRLNQILDNQAQVCLAQLASARGDQPSARKILADVLPKLADPLTSVRALLLDARLAVRNYNPKRADASALQAAEIANQNGLIHEATEAYSLCAKIAFQQDDLDRCRRLAGEGAASARKSGDQHALADALLYTAFAASRAGEPETAKKALTEASSVIDPLTTPMATHIRATISRVLEEIGEQEAAEAGYLRSVKEARAYEDQFFLAVNLTYLGDLLSAKGKPADALKVHAEALNIRKELKERLGTATSLRGLGKAHLELGQFQQARTALAESARLFLAEEAAPGYASSLLVLAHTEAKLNRLELASRLARRAAELLRGMSRLTRLAIGPEGDKLLEEAEQLASVLTR